MEKDLPASPRGKSKMSKVIWTTLCIWTALFTLAVISIPIQLMLAVGSIMTAFDTGAPVHHEPSLAKGILGICALPFTIPGRIMSAFHSPLWMLPVIWAIHLFLISLGIALFHHQHILLSRRNHYR